MGGCNAQSGFHTEVGGGGGAWNSLKHTLLAVQLVSKKILEEEIFAGTNFCELAFNRENRENFCHMKISRYTVVQLEVIGAIPLVVSDGFYKKKIHS